MLRQRVWNEVVVIVRAASKALVVPYATMQLGAALRLPASLVAFLAFSYLLPWTYENRRTYQQCWDLAVHRPRDRRPVAPTRAGRAGCSSDDHCAGSRTRDVLDSDVIEPAAALANVLGAAPERLFVSTGDICPICLELLPEPAAGIAESHSGREAAQELAILEPPLCGLRCGHVLHVECAEAALRVANRRHVRCPLCREPVTAAGAASARAFS